MIYTVTFNPSIDYLVNVENFKIGTVNRAISEHKYVGGKGINVSRVLKNLGIGNRALGFVGGLTGKFIIDSMETMGIETDFIEISGDTRINIKLKSGEETEINASGPIIEEEDLHKLFKKVSVLTSNDFLVLSGNLQKSLPKNIYSIIQEKCLYKGVKVIVDTSGEALIDGLKFNPLLVKPNSHELEETFNIKINAREVIINCGKKLREMGAENVIISMAEEGALLLCAEGIYHASAPKGTVMNSVGSGDSLIAGFIASYSKGFSLVESLKWGTATGSATAFSMDLCKKEDVLKLINQVQITSL